MGERPEMAVSRRLGDEIHPWTPNGDALRDVWLLTPPGGIIRAPRFLLKADLLDLICGGPLCESRPDIRAEIRERRLRVERGHSSGPGSVY